MEFSGVVLTIFENPNPPLGNTFVDIGHVNSLFPKCRENQYRSGTVVIRTFISNKIYVFKDFVKLIFLD